MSQSAAQHSLAGICGEPLSAVAVVGLISSAAYLQRPAGWLEVAEGKGASLTSFLHALELERGYMDSVIGFEDEEVPYYSGALVLGGADLAQVGKRMAMNRLLCLVAQTASGRIVVGRDYDGLEMTWLVDADDELCRFIAQVAQHTRTSPLSGRG